jgi:hypothetical protein
MGKPPFNKAQPPRWAMYVLLVLPVLWLVTSVSIVSALSHFVRILATGL